MQIKSYIITIISVVLMSVVAEGIMPDGNMKKHISLVMGIVILITVAKPVIAFTGSFFGNGFEIGFDMAEETSYDLTQKLENNVAEDVYNNFQAKLNAMMEEEILKEFNVACKPETVMDGGIVKHIKINGKANASIKEYIEKRFGINCVFEEVGDTNEIH